MSVGDESTTDVPIPASTSSGDSCGNCHRKDVIVSAQGVSCAYCGMWLKGPYSAIKKSDNDSMDQDILNDRRSRKSHSW